MAILASEDVRAIATPDIDLLLKMLDRKWIRNIAYQFKTGKDIDALAAEVGTEPVVIQAIVRLSFYLS